MTAEQAEDTGRLDTGNGKVQQMGAQGQEGLWQPEKLGDAVWTRLLASQTPRDQDSQE
jgi:hypothetical protein